MAICVAAPTLAVEPTHAPSPYAWENKVWQQASELLVDEALSRLPPTSSAGNAGERRELDYVRGVLLLNAQPKLQGNIHKSRDLLESVRHARDDDEPGLNALYYLARIAQFHTDPSDPAKASALYSELIQRTPDYPLAQEAVAKLAAIQLFEDVSPQERRARLAGFEAAATSLQMPSARRDLHFVLAEALLLFGDDKEGALRHLLAAEEAGILRQQLAANTMARVAVLARALGHREVAITHYKKFLATFQRDNRSYMLAEQLKSLEAEILPTSTPLPTQVTSDPAALTAPPTPPAMSSPANILLPAPSP